MAFGKKMNLKRRKKKSLAQQSKQILILMTVILVIILGGCTYVLNKTSGQIYEQMSQMAQLYAQELDNRFLRISRNLFSTIMDTNETNSTFWGNVNLMNNGDGLDLHAQALDGGKDTGDVVDDGHRGAHRHAEQSQELCVPRSGEQHHDADHSSIQQQYHRRIDGIIKIGALHGGIAVTDAPVIPALHVILQPQRPDGADVMQGLGHLPGDCGDRAAVVQLRGQHPLLDMTGEHGKQRQHQQQDQRKAGVFHRTHIKIRQ